MKKQNISNSSKIAKNTLYMYTRMLVILAVSLFTARIVFNTLGVTDYGIYNIVGSVIVLFSFINNGLSNATKRFITAELVSGNSESCKNVFNLAVISHFFIAVLIFFIAETLGLWGVNHVLKIPESRLFAANVAYQFSVIAAILGIMQSPFNAAIIAHEKMSIYAYFSILDVFFKLIIILLIQIVDSDKLILYSILTFCVSVINIIIYRIYCYTKFKMCRFQIPQNRTQLKQIFGYMGWSLAGQGSVVLTNQGVSMLINFFCGVVANAAMGVSNTIVNVVNNFVTNFQVAFSPQITKCYIAGQEKELNSLIYKTSKYSSFLVLIFLIPIVFEADNLLALWLGNYPLYAVEFCIFTLVAIYLEAISAPLWMVLGSDKNIRNYQITVSSIFLLNFILSWAFLYVSCPPYYVIIVRSCVNIILIYARLSMVRKRIISFEIRKWIHHVVFKSAIVTFFPLITAWIFISIEYKNLLSELLIVSAATCFITCTSIFFFGLEPTEKQTILLILKKKLGSK